MVIGKNRQKIKSKIFWYGAGLILIPVLSVSSAVGQKGQDALLDRSNQGQSYAYSKEIFQLKKDFVRQDLPAPEVTGSFQKKIQQEDEALISAIISQDLKRHKHK